MKYEDENRDGFWDLGQPREKKYAKPDFSGHTVAPVDISEDKTDETVSSDVTQGEKIPPRGEMSANQADSKKTISGSFWIDPIGGGRINTSSYRRHTTVRKLQYRTDAPTTRRQPGETTAEYTPNGELIKKITVRTWESETEFYGRFTSDALLSHRAKPSASPDADIKPVPYFSYVPQYAHMNREQVEYYRYVRENIRLGRCVPCDLPYLQLFIFEIINLDTEIDPTDGAELLARIWLGYRNIYPRLDGYLCEWFADYCMIHAVPMPRRLTPILAEITPKAQFKEFFLDSVLSSDSDALGSIVAEVASDYDYKSSRNYKDNKDLYDTHIPAVLTRVVRKNVKENRGVFALDRIYKMTRDSYCGAIVASDRKRRVDIEFCSFTRRADVRMAVTALVKYAENKIRQMIGVKAKLNVEMTDTASAVVIDAYFSLLIPQKMRSDEEKYMPDDYLKNYEAEESGFDLGRAEEIEKLSWANTERLTGEEFPHDEPQYTDSDDTPAVIGEITSDAEYSTEVEQNAEEEKLKPEVIPEKHGSAGDYKPLKDALRAALDGRYSEYCRSVGAFEGDMADRINTKMLDVLGDVLLESDGATYRIIEDYREECEEWLKTEQ